MCLSSSTRPHYFGPRWSTHRLLPAWATFGQASRGHGSPLIDAYPATHQPAIIIVPSLSKAPLRLPVQPHTHTPPPTPAATAIQTHAPQKEFNHCGPAKGSSNGSSTLITPPGEPQGLEYCKSFKRETQRCPVLRAPPVSRELVRGPPVRCSSRPHTYAQQFTHLPPVHSYRPGRHNLRSRSMGPAHIVSLSHGSSGMRLASCKEAVRG